MAKEYSIEISKAIEEFFRRDDWNFEPTDENGVIRTGVNLKSKLKNCKIFVLVKSNGFSVLSIPPISADDSTKESVMEFITRANYGTTYGNFEMDLDDGEVRYKTSMLCPESVPDFEQIRGMVYVNISTLDRYGNGLAQIMFGFGSVKEAIEACEND